MCRNPSGATSTKPLDTRPHHVRQRQRFAPAARRRNMTTAAVQSTRSTRSARTVARTTMLPTRDAPSTERSTALNISVKQGISYRDAVTQVKKDEKTRSTSTSSDITQQTAGVQGAKKATSAVASGTKTIKSVTACNKTDRTDDNARKETSARATPTLVSEANKSTAGNTSKIGRAHV